MVHEKSKVHSIFLFSYLYKVGTLGEMYYLKNVDPSYLNIFIAKLQFSKSKLFWLSRACNTLLQNRYEYYNTRF